MLQQCLLAAGGTESTGVQRVLSGLQSPSLCWAPNTSIQNALPFPACTASGQSLEGPTHTPLPQRPQAPPQAS